MCVREIKRECMCVREIKRECVCVRDKERVYVCVCLTQTLQVLPPSFKSLSELSARIASFLCTITRYAHPLA